MLEQLGRILVSSSRRREGKEEIIFICFFAKDNTANTYLYKIKRLLLEVVGEDGDMS